MVENKRNEKETVEFIQEMIKNSEKCIDDKGAYKCGELYESEVKEENRIPVAIFFDENTYNYHLFPYDQENLSGSVDRMKRIAKEIEELRSKVVEELIKKIPNNYVIIPGAGSGGDIKKLNKTYYSSEGANHLYRYILVKKKDIKYELNFMRFFISKDNKVHCILKAIQFDRCMLTSVNCDKGECRVCYPTSYQSQAARRDKIIEKNSKENLKSFCYNPDVSFSDNAELIADAFIKFIKKCDEWNNDNP